MIGGDRTDGDCAELSSAGLSHLPGLGGEVGVEKRSSANPLGDLGD